MLEYTSVYGYIKINRDYDRSAAFIKSLGKDTSFPFINTRMFSLGDSERPFYYENVMIGFAATYKYFGTSLDEWNNFILKIEHILRNTDFENAQFHVESDRGNYTLYWQSLQSIADPLTAETDPNLRLTRTDEWYFGFGRRSPFTGDLEDSETFREGEDLRNEPHLGFVYPVPHP